MFVCLGLLACVPLAAQEVAHDTLGALHVVGIKAGAPVVVLDLGRATLQVRTGTAGVVRAWIGGLSDRSSTIVATDQLATVREVDGVIRVTATEEGAVRGVKVILEVPAGVTLQARLSRGDITVSDVTGTLDLSTSRGDVQLENIAGSAIVDLRNGNVRATFRALHSELPSAIATLNGNVEIALARNAALQLDVRCRGCTLGSIPITRELQKTILLPAAGGDPVLGLHGPIGGGGTAFRVFTWNGEVTIAVR